MSLRSYKAPTKTVSIPGNDPLVVRGLSLSDIAPLASSFRPDIEKAFNGMFEKGLADLDVKQLAIGVFEIAPRLGAAIIAAGAGEPESVEAAATLPIGVQIDAFEKIGDLTFDAGGGAKKVMEAVIRMIRGAGGLLTPIAPILAPTR